MLESKLEAAAQLYECSPLRSDQNEIRLVTIEEVDAPSEGICCQFEMADLSSSPSYDTLSYVWGDAGCANRSL